MAASPKGEPASGPEAAVRAVLHLLWTHTQKLTRKWAGQELRDEILQTARIGQGAHTHTHTNTYMVGHFKDIPQHAQHCRKMPKRT